jgi:hypothetical protein
VNRVLLVLSAAVLFVSTLVTPSLASKIDGGSGGSTGCGGSTVCKP